MQVIHTRSRTTLGGLGGVVEDFLATPLGQQVKAKVLAEAQGYVTDNIKSVQFLTTFSKPIVYTGADIVKVVAGAGKPSPSGGDKGLVSKLKPTVIIDLKSGRRVIAPYGEANPKDYNRNVLLVVGGVLGVLGLYAAGSYYLGYKKGQRSR
jgi:hypothetical protein